eukprot:scaffold287_cov173-Amphora_coffeaeformis.AAC.25
MLRDGQQRFLWYAFLLILVVLACASQYFRQGLYAIVPPSDGARRLVTVINVTVVYGGGVRFSNRGRHCRHDKIVFLHFLVVSPSRRRWMDGWMDMDGWNSTVRFFVQNFCSTRLQFSSHQHQHETHAVEVLGGRKRYIHVGGVWYGTIPYQPYFPTRETAGMASRFSHTKSKLFLILFLGEDTFLEESIETSGIFLLRHPNEQSSAGLFHN